MNKKQLPDYQLKTLRLLAENKTLDEIGEELKISGRSVQSRINTLLKKANTTTRFGLGVWAAKNGLV